MRILLLTYEFTCAPFSGNGILARSIAKALLKSGCTVAVVCCRPNAGSVSESADNPITADEVGAESAARLQVWCVELGESEPWRRLDRAAAVGTFGAGCASRAPNISAFAPDVCLAIDWSAAAAWQVLKTAWPSPVRPPPLQYFNFRVYSAGTPSGSGDAAWYDTKEAEALAVADGRLCLSARDRDSLLALMGRVASGPASRDVGVLFPPLRDDVHRLATSASPDPEIDPHLPAACRAAVRAGKRFLTCVVRLSAEKQPLFYGQLLHAMARAGDIDSSDSVVPLLAGAAAEPEYAAQVREAVRSALGRVGVEDAPVGEGGAGSPVVLTGEGGAGSPVVLSGFLPPAALASIFRHTALNFHPCAYDAYGMTVVEAAAFGVPTLLQGGDAVGAAALLHADGCFQAALHTSRESSPDEAEAGGARTSSADAAASEVRRLLSCPAELARVGAVAQERALAWDEGGFGLALLAELRKLTADASSARAHTL